MAEKFSKRYRRFLLYGGYAVLPEKCFKVFELLSGYRWKYTDDPEFSEYLKGRKLVCVKPISALAEILGYNRATVKSAIAELKRWGIILEGHFIYKTEYSKRKIPYYVLGELDKESDKKFIWWIEKFQLDYIESCDSGDFRIKYLEKVPADRRKDMEKLPSNIIKLSELRKRRLAKRFEPITGHRAAPEGEVQF